MNADWNSLYSSHLDYLTMKTEDILQGCQFDTLLLSSGTLDYYFTDDQEVPFRQNPEFGRWCAANSPNHLIVVQPGQKPVMHYFYPDDFWSEHPTWVGSFWQDHFEIIPHKDLESLWTNLKLPGKTAYIGEPRRELEQLQQVSANPESVIHRLHWERAIKTPYEIQCIEKANEKAAPAHQAARLAFFEGKSEYEIFLAYLSTLQEAQHDLPYEPIVALDEKGGILHYVQRRPRVRGDNFLIDAGASFRGYASDITRTYISNGVHPAFRELVMGLNTVQQKLCNDMSPGKTMAELQEQAHLHIATLLQQVGIFKGNTAGDAVETGVTSAFYPHGLGHHLGLQVHDKGGEQIDPQGTRIKAEGINKYLRNRRSLDVGHVMTVEPGIYFIPFKLDALKNDGAPLDWDLVDALKPHGGVRIEDNVVVTETGHRNLTRPYVDFPIVD